jgi:hypothetical protein
MALFFQCGYTVDRINIEWGYNRIIAERFMSVNQIAGCGSYPVKDFTSLTNNCGLMQAIVHSR